MNRNSYMRICVTVLMGVLIPYLSGLIRPNLFNASQLIVTLIFFITLAFIIMRGARIIHHRMRQFHWLNQQLLKKISAICAVVSLYSVFVAGVLVFVWGEIGHYRTTVGPIMQFLANTVLTMIIVTLIEEMLLMNYERRNVRQLPTATVDTIPLSGAIMQHALTTPAQIRIIPVVQNDSITESDTAITEKPEGFFDAAITHRRKSRLLLRKGLENIPVRLDDLALLYTENKIVYALDHTGRKYVADKKLSELESELDATMFFRANRQYIIALNFIKGFKPYDKVKLQVDLTVSEGNHLVIISQETAPAFRKWMNDA